MNTTCLICNSVTLLAVIFAAFLIDQKLDLISKDVKATQAIVNVYLDKIDHQHSVGHIFDEIMEAK